MRRKECVAMLLAGGEGRRLEQLTKQLAKPAVHFGGKYRIIDFTLSNCTNSDIDTVGVLTQYQPLVLNSYIGIGSSWDLDRKNGGVTVLSPFLEQKGGNWYSGTANAIYRNIGFLEQYDPEYVLVISGDHIYKMDYDEMLSFHKERGAEATIAVIEVDWKEASRFGIMSVDGGDRVTEFAEKPKEPKSNLASMGVYIFTWSVLKSYLLKDEANPDSSNDFGKDVIPMMLEEGARLFAYPFEGYWKDVGTVQSLWEAHMDLLEDKPKLDLFDRSWRIYSLSPYRPPQYVAPTATISRSLINEGCSVYGEIDHSVLFYGVQVGGGSVVKDSVIMPNVTIGSGVRVYRSIIGEGTVIEDGCVIGTPTDEESADIGEITLIGGNEYVRKVVTA
ncbi:glucose-1-phosphate adenylyltransferase [Paenibacillus thermotolerans]|uniref:glucose-1-phosphate adenylyltransferase n=1 Tax=Paenibacillus thermotolerans TaxID=3027807 RepID=UPI0023674698|nr:MULTISPECIES: glucose-1-phosphate adenylyltransferase [unclassified Paenibacillus]